MLNIFSLKNTTKILMLKNSKNIAIENFSVKKYKKYRDRKFYCKKIQQKLC